MGKESRKEGGSTEADRNTVQGWAEGGRRGDPVSSKGREECAAVIQGSQADVAGSKEAERGAYSETP